MWDYLKLVVLGLIALGAAIAANYAWDLAYMVNAVTVMLAAGITFLVVLRSAGEVRTVNKNEYMDGVVRAGVIATSFWGVVGFLVGVVIASQLAWPWLNFEALQGIGNFGRLRPLGNSTDEVLRHLARLWGFTVRLETVDEHGHAELSHEVRVDRRHAPLP